MGTTKPINLKLILHKQVKSIRLKLSCSRVPLSGTLKGTDKKLEVARISKQCDFDIATLHQEKIRDSEILRIR